MLQTEAIETIAEPHVLTEQLSIQPLGSADPGVYPDNIRSYFIHYGLDVDSQAGVEHRFGSFQSGGIELAAHLYAPSTCSATVLLLHGYLNHSGQLRHLIRDLLHNGFAVAVFDLPGHGLSQGAPADIESFEQYVKAVQDFMKVVRTWLQGPYHVIGFSTGAAIAIDMLLTDRAACFEQVVLAAPLIHWALYEQSKGTYKVYSAFTDRIARFHRRNSSDRQFLIFNKTQDYLHRSHLSLKWVKALFDWNERLAALPPCDKEVLVLQGDKDSTVDWKYNLPLIRNKFPKGRIELIHGADHELFNEALEYKEQAMLKINLFLQEVRTLSGD